MFRNTNSTMGYITEYTRPSAPPPSAPSNLYPSFDDPDPPGGYTDRPTRVGTPVHHVGATHPDQTGIRPGKPVTWLSYGVVDVHWRPMLDLTAPLSDRWGHAKALLRLYKMPTPKRLFYKQSRLQRAKSRLLSGPISSYLRVKALLDSGSGLPQLEELDMREPLPAHLVIVYPSRKAEIRARLRLAYDTYILDHTDTVLLGTMTGVAMGLLGEKVWPSKRATQLALCTRAYFGVRAPKQVPTKTVPTKDAGGGTGPKVKVAQAIQAGGGPAQEPVRQEPVRQEPVRQEPVRQEPVRHSNNGILVSVMRTLFTKGDHVEAYSLARYLEPDMYVGIESAVTFTRRVLAKYDLQASLDLD